MSLSTDYTYSAQQIKDIVGVELVSSPQQVPFAGDVETKIVSVTLHSPKALSEEAKNKVFRIWAEYFVADQMYRAILMKLNESSSPLDPWLSKNSDLKCQRGAASFHAKYVATEGSEQFQALVQIMLEVKDKAEVYESEVRAKGYTFTLSSRG